MKTNDFLFVYGTLRRGERADLQKQAHNFGVTFMGEDRINAKMYHLGAYPGVKGAYPAFDDTLPTITGEVFLIRDLSVAALMDAYEGYDADEPTRGLYDRVQVFSEQGRQVWVYTYNGRVTPDQLIESGDWCKNPSMPIRTRVLRA